mgnify:FL=1|jgi:hypothetical protein|tara:strand:+ start:82 stop:885 length:804 start_codon:yes stop_codon:yes gene_type:complete
MAGKTVYQKLFVESTRKISAIKDTLLEKMSAQVSLSEANNTVAVQFLSLMKWMVVTVGDKRLATVEGLDSLFETLQDIYTKFGDMLSSGGMKWFNHRVKKGLSTGNIRTEGVAAQRCKKNIINKKKELTIFFQSLVDNLSETLRILTESKNISNLFVDTQKIVLNYIHEGPKGANVITVGVCEFGMHWPYDEDLHGPSVDSDGNYVYVHNNDTDITCLRTDVTTSAHLIRMAEIARYDGIIKMAKKNITSTIFTNCDRQLETTTASN